MKKETQPQHTQGEKWKINYRNSDVIEITAEDNWRVIAQLTTFDRERPKERQTFEQTEANAQRIVKAVNMHDELIETIQEAKKLFNDFSTHIPVGYSRLKTDWLNFQDKLTKQLLKQSE